MHKARAERYPELEFKKILGWGATSVVYTGIWQGRDVAVKQLDQRYIKTKAKYKRSELEYLLSLEHENIVRILDFIESDDEVLIITELAERGSLHAIINSVSTKRLTFEWARRLGILLNVAQAMVYLHGKGTYFLSPNGVS